MPAYIINSSGEEEPFSLVKVHKSARMAGAGRKLAKKITEIITGEVYDGMKTSEIFKRVRELLKQQSPRSALRFNLKEAMKRLGPTGFPFEEFIGGVFKSMGFFVKINQYIPGFCLNDYEIDFLAKKEKLIYMGECKYRNLSGEKVHIQDALANYARFLDIQKGPYFAADKKRGCEIKTIMVTNAKFTNKITAYASCVGVSLLGWRYPKNEGLEYLVEQYKLYPITILPSLRGYLKDIFVSEKIMLAKDVLKINLQEFSRKFKIPEKQIYSLAEEARILLEE